MRIKNLDRVYGGRRDKGRARRQGPSRYINTDPFRLVRLRVELARTQALMVDSVKNKQVLDRIAATLGISVSDLCSSAIREGYEPVDAATREATIAQLEELAARGTEPKHLIEDLLKVLRSLQG